MPFANGVNLATAFIEIVPNTKGLGSSLVSQMGPQMGAAGKAAGDTMGKGMLGTMGKVGSALAALGIAGFLKDSADKAMRAQVSWSLLSRAVDNTGASFSSAAEGIRATLGAEEKLSAFAGGELRTGLTSLVQITGNVGKAQSLLGLTADLARAKQMDMATAAKLVGRVSLGSTAILTRYGIVLKKGATATEALAAMQQKFGGAAEAYGNTTQGSTDKANNALAKLQVTIGTALLPTIGKIADAVTGALDLFQQLPGPVKEGAIEISAVGAAALFVAPLMGKVAATFPVMAAKAGIAAIANNTLAASILGVVGAGTLLVGGAAIMSQVNKANQEAAITAALAANSMDDLDASMLRALGIDPVVFAASHKVANSASAIATSADDAASALNNEVRAMNGAKVAADTLAGVERSLTDLDLASRTAKLDLTDAQKALTDARKHHKKGSEEVQRAEIAVTQAQEKAKDAAYDLADAQATAGVKVDGTKGKITDYRKELGLIPGDVTTTVNAHLNDSSIRAWIAKVSKLDPGMGAIMARMYPVKKHDAGGYFTSPHIAQIAEAGNPEYVINPRRATAPVLITAAARDAGMAAPAGGGTFAPTVNVYADSMADARRIGDVVEGVLSDVARRASATRRASGMRPAY